MTELYTEPKYNMAELHIEPGYNMADLRTETGYNITDLRTETGYKKAEDGRRKITLVRVTTVKTATIFIRPTAEIIQIPATMSIFLIFLTIGVLAISSVQGVAYLTSEPYMGKKYLLSKNPEVFDLAKMNARCRGSGGYLVDIDNFSEQHWLEFFVSYEAGNHVVYTGITDVGSEGRYYHYNTKKPASYLGWKRGQPDNWKGKEHCVNIAYNGINDIDCGRKALYICELPA